MNDSDLRKVFSAKDSGNRMSLDSQQNAMLELNEKAKNNKTLPRNVYKATNKIKPKGNKT